MKRVLIVGCGFVGLPLGRTLARRGHVVFGLRRTPAAAEEMTAAGIRPLMGDITEPASLTRLPTDWDWVINCAASGGGGAAEYRRLYYDGTRCLLEWLNVGRVERYIYTSSTGVYGQDDGSVVSETSATQPASVTAQILVQTEQVLLTAAREQGFPAVILRLSGIYGGGRGYWLRQILSGEARLEGDGERILNMIHREDVVEGIAAALERGQSGEIYNVTDDEPVAQRVLFEWLSRRLGRPILASGSSATQSQRRAATSKAVSNRRLRVDLGVRLAYPTFREGYEAEIGERESGGIERSSTAK